MDCCWLEEETFDEEEASVENNALLGLRDRSLSKLGTRRDRTAIDEAISRFRRLCFCPWGGLKQGFEMIGQSKNNPIGLLVNKKKTQLVCLDTGLRCLVLGLFRHQVPVLSRSLRSLQIFRKFNSVYIWLFWFLVRFGNKQEPTNI